MYVCVPIRVIWKEMMLKVVGLTLPRFQCPMTSCFWILTTASKHYYMLRPGLDAYLPVVIHWILALCQWELIDTSLLIWCFLIVLSTSKTILLSCLSVLFLLVETVSILAWQQSSTRYGPTKDTKVRRRLALQSESLLDCAMPTQFL